MNSNNSINFNKPHKPNVGFTLIELLVAIAITSILIGTVALMLKSSFAVYHFTQEEIILQKILDEVLEEVSAGGFEGYGLKDSLEILDASSCSVTFVPLWIDDTHRITVLKPNATVVLNRPFKAGAALPIGEVSLRDKSQDTISERWHTTPITFILGSYKDPSKLDDKVIFNEPLLAGAKVRVVFQPDSSYFPDTAATFKWHRDKKTFLKTYKGQTTAIPKRNLRGAILTSVEFQYFDNTNTLIPFQVNGSIADELLAQITAVKIILKAQTKERVKQSFCFINLRNSRSSGMGNIIRQGTRFKIPDSRQISVFSIANIVGVKEGDCIDIEAHPKKGTVWKIHMELGVKGDNALIKKYAISYPPGLTRYFETINLTTDLPLNFLTLGRNGFYDYDFDEDGRNVVDLKGEVELVVTRMDVAGASLFIRP